MRKIMIVVAVLTGLALTGCAAETGVSTKPGSQATSSAGGEETGDDGDNNVTKVGQWARADDGVAFRVATLRRGRVSDIASGGHPGDPAVVVTVQIKNRGKHRVDLSMVEVTARLGKSGDEAERVFQDGVDEGLTGTLAPGRTVSDKYMFAAAKASDLKVVSVEIAPGVEYDSATFEGGL
ncbi:hypothetical protein [Actinomadura sp. GTD37]|uniref:hypothetical protein n=1 Tax=Actinomadura sp. GTD37 TaxID=1778030 RepID=UPI0035C02708